MGFLVVSVVGVFVVCCVFLLSSFFCSLTVKLCLRRLHLFLFRLWLDMMALTLLWPTLQLRSEVMNIFSYFISSVNSEKADILSCSLLITEEHKDIRVMLNSPKCLFASPTWNHTCTHVCSFCFLLLFQPGKNSSSSSSFFRNLPCFFAWASCQIWVLVRNQLGREKRKRDEFWCQLHVIL